VGIAAGRVTATELASNAVTSAKLAANAVTSGAIVNGAVVSAKIADGAVTDAEVSGPITFAKIGNAFPAGILFGGPTGILSQAAPGLFWDSSNHRLGLGTGAPSQQLELTGTMKMADTAAAAGVPSSGVLFLGSKPFLHGYVGGFGGN